MRMPTTSRILKQHTRSPDPAIPPPLMYYAYRFHSDVAG